MFDLRSYTTSSVDIVAYSVAPDAHSEIATFLVTVPPNLAHVITGLQRAYVTPTWWGQTREELLAGGIFLNTPYRPMGDSLNGADSFEHKWKETFSQSLDFLNTLADAGAPAIADVHTLLAPFMAQTFVVTATEWYRVMKELRATKNPVMEAVAASINNYLNVNDPHVLEQESWHMPFITMESIEEITVDAHELHSSREVTAEQLFDRTIEQATLVSIARCARGGVASPLTGQQETLSTEIERGLAIVDQWPIYNTLGGHISQPDYVVNGKWMNPQYHGPLYGFNNLNRLWMFDIPKGDLGPHTIKPTPEATPPTETPSPFTVIQGGIQ